MWPINALLLTAKSNTTSLWWQPWTKFLKQIAPSQGLNNSFKWSNFPITNFEWAKGKIFQQSGPQCNVSLKSICCKYVWLAFSLGLNILKNQLNINFLKLLFCTMTIRKQWQLSKNFTPWKKFKPQDKCGSWLKTVPPLTKGCLSKQNPHFCNWDY